MTVPESATLALFAVAVAMLLLVRRRGGCCRA
ncbi:MAG: PEP-CTERM sorting domain-containing protein [Phycisphaerae bacterium]